jgi:thioredoxin-related protein
MRTRFACAVGVFALLAFATSALANPGWSENFAEASARAKAEKKLLLVNFTGSDWCPACVQIDKDVYLRPEFREYAKKSLVLFEADFPMNLPQSPEVKAQNEQLRLELGVNGYPTLVVLNPEGRKVAQLLGYQPGGPTAFIADLEQIQLGHSPWPRRGSLLLPILAGLLPLVATGAGLWYVLTRRGANRAPRVADK